MTSRERVRRILDHREVDQVAIQDRVWEITENRWRKEGLPEGVSLQDYFCYEISRVWIDVSPQFPAKLLQQNERYTIRRDSYGQITKCHTQSPAKQVIDSSVKSRRDWEEVRNRLRPNDNRLISFTETPYLWFDWREALDRFDLERRKGRFIAFSSQIGFGLLHRYLGVEELLLTIATDPEWVKDMAITQARLLISMYELMAQKGFCFDGVYLSNDMGHQNGLLFSPRAYQEAFYPADELLCNYFRNRNLPLILHSDGDIRQLIPDLIEVGFSCLEPLEAKANMNVTELKSQYGDRLVLMGGIDVRLMADRQDPRLIEHEIRTKLTIAKERSGYIYHSDHSIPPNVSFKRYQYIIQLVRRYGTFA